MAQGKICLIRFVCLSPQLNTDVLLFSSDSEKILFNFCPFFEVLLIVYQNAGQKNTLSKC